MSIASNSFTRNEPVLVAHASAAVLGFVLTSLVTHHVIGSVTASALTQQLLPAIVTAATLALGLLTRAFTSPAKKVEHALTTSGLMSDADFGRMEALLGDLLVAHLAIPLTPELAVAVPDLIPLDPDAIPLTPDSLVTPDAAVLPPSPQ